AGDFFFQKRVPKGAPDWLQTATVKFPSGRSATELCGNDAAHLVWAVSLGVIDFNPWPARRADLDHPDELRVDLDPTPASSIDDAAGSLSGLLELSARDEAEGLGDAPWSPNFPKQKGEPKRVQPSRARKR